MKTLLAMFLLLPSLSWGNIYTLQCYNDDPNDDAKMQTWRLDTYNKLLTLKSVLLKNGLEAGVENNNFKIFSVENSIIKTFINHPDYGRQEFHYNTIKNELKNLMIGKSHYCDVNTPINISKLNEEKLNEEKSKKLDIKNQCLDFGFKEGTEGFANCQLELTILEKQTNNSDSGKSNQISNNNSQDDYMKQQNKLLEQQLRIQQEQLDLAEREKNKKVWKDFIDQINPQPKLKCRQNGINTVCY